MHEGTSILATLLVLLAVCIPSSCMHGKSNQPCDDKFETCARAGALVWPRRCDSPFKEDFVCTSSLEESGDSFDDRTFVVILNSFEKLTWATVGLGRLLIMANSSVGISFVEPCVADSGAPALPLHSNDRVHSHFQEYGQCHTFKVSEHSR